MRTLWIYSSQVTKAWLVTGIASVFVLCGPNAEAVEVHPEVQQEICVQPPDCPRVIVDEMLERSFRFQELVSRWRSERGATSSITSMAMCDAYQRIIGMGPEAIRLVISQLRSEGDEPDQWFWALKVLSGADPVKEEDRGDFLKMTDAWIAWAENEGYAR